MEAIRNNIIVDGTGSTAEFISPRGAAVDSYGNVYVADGDIISKRILASSVPATILQVPSINAGQSVLA